MRVSARAVSCSTARKRWGEETLVKVCLPRAQALLSLYKTSGVAGRMANERFPALKHGMVPGGV
jgi:hypothetical protein